MRPTYGRVSRHGAMALSWSMDKLGPMCRSIEDCALVFAAIHGADGLDPTAHTLPFDWDSGADLEHLRVGFLAASFQREDEEYDTRDLDLATLETLRELGHELIPLEMPDFPIKALELIMYAEGVVAFHELTLSNRDDLMVRQVKDAYPNANRQARFIPAVEYIQANRARTLLMQQMAEMMRDVDVVMTPARDPDALLGTNLTGHPCSVVPNGFRETGTPSGITFIGQLYRDAETMALAHAYQRSTDFHHRHPALDNHPSVATRATP